jgi:hypothetical protein
MRRTSLFLHQSCYSSGFPVTYLIQQTDKKLNPSVSFELTLLLRVGAVFVQ